VVLLALGQERLQRGNADGAAEIAHHVGDARSARSVFRWRCLHALVLAYGCVLLSFAFTQY